MKILKLFLSIFIFTNVLIYSQDKQDQTSPWIDRYDMEQMSIPELYRLKETIYAKHNYSFSSDSSRIYFSQFDWYSPTLRNSLIEISESEELTIAKINDRIESLLYEKVYTPQTLSVQSRIDKYSNLTLKEKGHIGLFSYSIKNVFEYNDKAGQHFIFLGESPYNPFSQQQDRAIFNNVIKAVYCTAEDGYLTKKIEIEDLINPYSSIFDIRFMPQYISLEDIDQDGYVDPIITYSTMGKDGYRNGRTKISLIYKRNIISIDIQNSDNKEDRLLNITTRFHLLPYKIKQRLIDLVLQIEKDGVYQLPDSWETEFNNPFK